MSYTKSIIHLICNNPNITNKEIQERLKLENKNISTLIHPYIKRKEILARTVPSSTTHRRSVQYTSTPELTISFKEKNISPENQHSPPRPYKKWSTTEKIKLENIYPLNSNRFVAKVLDRSEKQIESQAHKMKLRKHPDYIQPTGTGDDGRPFISWRPEDVALLKEHYPDEKSADLASSLGKTTGQIIAKARRLGIQKSDEFWKRGSDHLRSFAGAKINSSVPIGSITIWNNYAFEKTGDPSIWKLKHQIDWIAQHGAYNTNTHSLWFIDRNSRNYHLSNLELITIKEKFRRISESQHPKELRDVIHLYNELKRRLREKY